jgi:DNA-nicking Smr family endonuclease
LRERNRQSTKEGEDPLGHRPFRSLKKLIGKPGEKAAAPRANREAPAPAAPKPAEVPVEKDEDLFLREIGEVKRLDQRQRQRVAAPPPAQPGRPVVSDDAEALAELADLVTGKAPFDLSDSDEYLEGSVKGLDPRIVRRLRRGEFAHQAHLDLHGMTAEEARPAVDRFLLEAYRAGRRCVLIIHGRGLNSRDQIPVLKNRLAGWLARGQWARLVLAFSSARLFDGGSGALYVLLRRERGSKKEIEVLNGAKS